ncbi:hypothetical protein HPP92_014397 [Vanilla planifolia]|uniref:E2 ubiquitin-conjugating enzyme n=1 Tax=Vanilla planifolia TaxID=51239 RepID=A0A835UU08_VANPL|nr:hypothetical protein HPP92_014397 [Vanilla planifolia]
MEGKHYVAVNNQADHVPSGKLKNLSNHAEPTLNFSLSESGCVPAVVPETLSDSLPNDIYIYREDVVRCIKQEGLLGVVMEVAGDSDSEGSITDESDIEENLVENNIHDDADGHDFESNDEMYNAENSFSLPDGQVKILWTDGSESTEDMKDITVLDRGFLHGDIVSSVSDPAGQLGLVLDVSIMVDLQTSNGELIKNISSKDLKRIREFTIGDYVVLGPWLGRVDDVLDNVTVLFDDGSVCKVIKADPLRLKAVSRPVIDDANCPYYPGQRVRAVSSSVFKSSRWLSGLWKASRLEGTVIKVQTASLIVYWMASAYLGVGATSDVPSEEQNPKDLTLLSCFSYANWQLGDWCLLPSLFANKSSESASLQEPIGECNSGARNPNEVPNLVNFCRSSETEKNVLVDTPTLSYDDADHLVANQVSDNYTENSLMSICDDGNYQLQDNSTTHSNLTESIAPESSETVLKCDSCSSSSTVRESAHEGWPAYRKKLRRVLFKREKKASKKVETFERALLIVNTVTKVDVAWQNGSRDYGLESTSLIPIHTPNDHEFFPEQYVVEKETSGGEDSVEPNRVGIVRSLNSKERTVRVKWFKPVSCPEEPRQFSCDELVSAYELDEHPDYDYCYGDVVVRLSPASTSSQSEIALDKLGENADEAGRESDVDAQSSKQESLKSESWVHFKSLSWVGNITGLQDGDIEVTWADGMVSKVGPQAIYVVGRDDDADSYEGGSEISDGGASWETVDGNEMDILENAEQESDLEGARNILTENPANSPPEDISPGKSGALSVSLAAINFVTRLATGLFSRNNKSSDSSEAENKHLSETENLEIQDVTVNGAIYEDLETSEQQSYLATIEDADKSDAASIDSSKAMADVANIEADSDGGFHSFKHFDISESPADHYFLSSPGQGSGGRKWVKKIQQEWSILEKNLPDAIYVSVYEDRMDLFRAVIVGASGTPYQDGLFFFDFHLSPEYPQSPPVAYYHSGGLRINPNLYVDGKVCLSLLNTWTGKGNEVWDPSSSSILQVLVSLQGLVLNSKPYFNEAGYEKQVGTLEGEKNSVPYNENTYLLNLKSMMYLLRRPPLHFEGFVKDHFQRRAYYILKACEAYLGGCAIGTLTKDAGLTEKSKEQSCSVGFKLMLSKMLPRLTAAFAKVGVDCNQFAHLIQPEDNQ